MGFLGDSILAVSVVALFVITTTASGAIELQDNSVHQYPPIIDNESGDGGSQLNVQLEKAEIVPSYKLHVNETPTMDEQCKARRGENAVVGYANCTDALCWLGNGYTIFRPMENTTCFQNGRCFQGSCFQATLSYFTNLESRACLQGSDPFSGTDNVNATSCPQLSSPMNHFRTIHVNTGYWLTIRYSTSGNTGDKTKCLVAPDKEGGLVGFGPCSVGGRTEWDLVAVSYGEYLLIETRTGRCAKQEGNSVIAVNCGDRNDRSMRWRSNAVTE